MREQDDQLNEDMVEESGITGINSDPEDDSILELPDNEVTDDDELQELNLGER
jgi:hypothetical protein